MCQIKFEVLQFSEEVYDEALELISQAKLQEAIKVSLEYCRDFVSRISDAGLLAGEFKVSDVEEYVAEVQSNLAKLTKDTTRRSSTVVLDVLNSGRGSGVYLELISESDSPPPGSLAGIVKDATAEAADPSQDKGKKSGEKNCSIS